MIIWCFYLYFISTVVVWTSGLASWCASPWKGNYLSHQYVCSFFWVSFLYKCETSWTQYVHLVLQVSAHRLSTVVSLQTHHQVLCCSLCYGLGPFSWWCPHTLGAAGCFYHTNHCRDIPPPPPPTAHLLPGWDHQSSVCQSCPLWWKTKNCWSFGPGAAYLHTAVSASHHFVHDRD